ncbi:MAG TPA: phospholipase D-like domain-containing protein, partial [Byssovorax sp.]
PQAISAAQTSVHMTMYILSDHGTIDALIERHQAGVDVKVVLNQSFPGDATDSQSNQDVFDQLQGAGVPVVWAPGVFQYTHEKSFVVDGTTAWIMTMNAANSSPDDNREYLAIDTIPEHVQEDEAVFEGDFAGAPVATVDGPLVVAPINAHTDLDAFVATAKSTIDIEAEELSDDTFIDALVAASHAGVAIRVVLPDPNPNSFNGGHALTSAQQEALTRMKAAAFGLVWITNPYVHAKTIVVDGTSAYVGSANFTYTSLEMNRELGVLFAVEPEIAKITATINQDFAAGTPF